MPPKKLIFKKKLFKKWITRVISIVVSCAISTSSFAKIDSFEKHVKNMGFITNNTKSGVMQDQQAGYYTGGSITMRGLVSNTSLVNIQLPSINAGCGGIDLFKGAFSFIDQDGFDNLITSIAQGALGYAVELGLDTLSSQIGNVLKGLRREVNFINSQNINSCQMAAALVSGPFPKSEAAQRMACQAREMGGSKVVDHFTSRHECSKKNDSDIDKGNGGNRNLESVLGTEYNLVYKALKKNNITDEHLISLLMSTSGTYISRMESGKRVFEFKPSLFKDLKNLESLLKGSKAGGDGKVYTCRQGNSECLYLDAGSISFSDQNNALNNKIEALLKSIISKILTEKGPIRSAASSESEGSGTSSASASSANEGVPIVFSPEEDKLISTSTVPILKIITLESMLKGGDVSLGVGEYVEVITFDLLINYLEELLDLVYNSVTQLGEAQFNKDLIDEFKKELREVKYTLNGLRFMAFKRVNVIIAVKQRAVQIEKQLNSLFSEYLSVDQE